MKTYLILNQNNENGFSAIIMVVILMVIGLLLLTGFNQLLISWHKTIAMETRYYQTIQSSQFGIKLGVNARLANTNRSVAMLKRHKIPIKSLCKKITIKSG